jgi:malate dehydrogenase (oxaloacetate-decarboxylating)(NADP+)
MANHIKEDALKYHASWKPGKIEVIPTKPYSTQYDLSLAYSPGVAEPCKKIADNPDDVYTYTYYQMVPRYWVLETSVLLLVNL